MTKNILSSFLLSAVLYSLILFFLTPITLAQESKPTNVKLELHDRPNIVLILADDLGWADLPIYGNTFHDAPHIEKLASEGMRFTNAYAACPVCSPTRASIQSGQYPARVGVIDFIPGHWRPFEKVIVPQNRTQYLPQEIITIGEAMKDAGYSTGYFGKWHLGNKPEHHPLNQGYDEANTGYGHYNVKLIPEREESSSKRLTERLTDFSEEFIEKNKSQPFFLFLSYYDVHIPLVADMDLVEKYLKKKKRDTYPGNAIYAAMIEYIDNSVGRIVAKLDECGLEENTIVIFASDNGGLIAAYDQRILVYGRNPRLIEKNLAVYETNPLKYIATSNAPLHNEKGTVYEGGIRVPLIVKWPGKIEEGSRSDAIVTSVDFYPTLLELAMAEKPRGQVLDGKSLLPELLENRYNPQRAIFWHYPVYHHDVPAGAIRKGDWKLIENQVTGEVSLYNLRADISESMDLSDLYPEKTEELKKLLKNWQKEVKAEFPVPNPDFGRKKKLGRHPNRK